MILTDTNKMRDVSAAVADQTRSELIRLLADAVELPLQELTSVKPKSDRKN